MSAVSPIRINNGQKYFLQIALANEKEKTGLAAPTTESAARNNKYQNDNDSYSSISDFDNLSSDYLSPDEIFGNLKTSSYIIEENINKLNAINLQYNSQSEQNNEQHKTYLERKESTKYPGNKKSGYPSKHISLLVDNTNPKGNEEDFPREQRKTLISLLLMIFCFFLTVTSLCLTHDRLPNRSIPPLPDIMLDNMPFSKRALSVSEYIIIFCLNSAVVVMVIHKHRFIVCRRIFLIMSLLYLYRAVTMYVTVLPIANKLYPCAPKSNDPTLTGLMKRVVRVMSGLGLSVNGQHVYCGDFIFSGHTVTLTLAALVISEYTPKNMWCLHYLYWVLCWLGILLLELAHGHYTIDIITAYFVTTRVFWLYHAMANNIVFKQKSPDNHLSKLWWYKMFLFLEENVKDIVPNEYNWPIVCQKREHIDFE